MNNLSSDCKEILKKNYSNGHLTFDFNYKLKKGKLDTAELLITDKEANVFVSRYQIVDGKIVFNIFSGGKVVLSSISPATMRYISEQDTITVPLEELGSFLEAEYLLEIREFAPSQS